MAETERDKELRVYQEALDKSIKLEALESQADWGIVQEVLEGLVISYSNAILNGDPADHNTYLVNRAKLDGVRAVQGAFDTIKKNGRQASNAINQLNT